MTSLRIGRMQLSDFAPPRSAKRVVVPEPGDQVRVGRGLYSHHAIYVGEGWFVEFGSSMVGGPVAHVTWAELSRGARIELVRRGGQIAVERALSQLGRDDFNVLTANCEHFATWCTTGRWESSQAQFVGAVAVTGALLLLLRKAG